MRKGPYMKRDLINSENWIDKKKAFPDLNCTCLTDRRHKSMIPVRCSKCGADRTKDNWSGNQSKGVEVKC